MTPSIVLLIVLWAISLYLLYSGGMPYIPKFLIETRRLKWLDGGMIFRLQELLGYLYLCS
jgi:hypothetical protein